MQNALSKQGLSLVEMIVVIAILVVLALGSIPVIYHFQSRTHLDNTAAQLVNHLRLVQSKTIASTDDSQWGIYFSLGANPQSYTLFKGVDYTSRDTNFDKTYQLPKEIEIFNLNLTGGLDEMVFEKVTGQTSQHGSISVRKKGSASELRIIYIEALGGVRFVDSLADDTGRLKDSRRVHFTYDRIIDTSTESLILSFDGGPAVNIVIASNLSGGQIFWSDDIESGGSAQSLTLHTLRLNNPDTLFCLHRDRRYNNNGFDLDISADLAPSPNLMRYQADGSTVQGNSLNVSTPLWQ